MKPKSGNWKTATTRLSLRLCQIITMELDFTLLIWTFAATECLLGETVLGNKLSNIKRYSLSKNSNNRNSSFGPPSEIHLQLQYSMLSVNYYSTFQCNQIEYYYIKVRPPQFNGLSAQLLIEWKLKKSLNPETWSVMGHYELNDHRIMVGFRVFSE